MYIYSIILIVFSNIVYNISQKSTPHSTNPFVPLLVTYVTAALLTLVSIFVFKSDKGIVESLHQVNWTSFILGIAIVGLELGYLLAYRAGWNISAGSLVANILLAVSLIPVGVLLYNEVFELNKMIGVAFCILGLVLLNK